MAGNANEIIIKLHSEDLAEQISGLDQVGASLRYMLDQAAEALFVSSSRYPIAEKLFAMGPAIIPSLENLLQVKESSEAVTYAALILFKLGSTSGLPLLLKSLSSGTGPVGMIAEVLGAAKCQRLVRRYAAHYQGGRSKKIHILQSL